MGFYCKEHLKEGIVQNRLLYNSLDVKRLDYKTECNLCKKDAEYWVG